MIYAGKQCAESRAFADGTGTGTEWRTPGNAGPWTEPPCIREHATRILTPEEIATEAARLAAWAKVQARLAKLRDLRAKIRAGTDTAADRARAIRLLIGVLLSIAPEDDES